MPEDITASTQEHIDILDIKDDLVVLKNGIVCGVLETTSVNFPLLTEVEQDAKIDSFSMLLNSIEFPMQIVLRSQKLDISKYVEKVYKAEQRLEDPLLKLQAEAYRKFVQDTIKNNEVLSKSFYVVIPTGEAVERKLSRGPFDFFVKLMGINKRQVTVNVNKAVKEGEVNLYPKIDHVIKEFNRIGIKARRLGTQELVELYFDIYNPSTVHGQRIRTNIEDYKTAVVNPAIVEE